MKTLEKPAVQRRGVLLPQHFELRDQYLEALLDEWVAVLSPAAWGLAELSIDAAALAEERFRVTALLARFPSGELAHVGAGDAPLELSVPSEALSEAPLDVFVGLADRSDDGPNAADEKGPDLATRYRSAPPRSDRGGPTLHPRVRLYAGFDPRLPTDRIRLAQVRSTRVGVEVDPEVLPPALWPLPGTFLPGALTAITGALATRQAQLLAARRDRPHEPLTFPAEQTVPLLALSIVQQAMAALAYPSSRRGIPPWEVHRVLSELLGAIDALEGTIAPIPTYTHEDAGPGFKTLVTRLLVAIPALARPAHEILHFVRKDAATFELKVAEPAILRRPVFLVLVGGERGLLEQGVPAYAKLASDVWLPRIVQTAVHGIELAPDFDPPTSLPSSANSACFRLNTRSDYWTNAVERGSFALHLPSAPPELRVALYVMNDR